jgi:hypothetical protein
MLQPEMTTRIPPLIIRPFAVAVEVAKRNRICHGDNCPNEILKGDDCVAVETEGCRFRIKQSFCMDCFSVELSAMVAGVARFKRQVKSHLRSGKLKHTKR